MPTVLEKVRTPVVEVTTVEAPMTVAPVTLRARAARSNVPKPLVFNWLATLRGSAPATVTVTAADFVTSSLYTFVTLVIVAAGVPERTNVPPLWLKTPGAVLSKSPSTRRPMAAAATGAFNVPVLVRLPEMRMSP